ncbi:Ferrous iron permease EfeU [Marinomonas spartinae]|uniref:Ferrous iron permease EfeU n=1 Tax=Marinomonas spartinae TaxID=1792290 RepID=A0A1A8TUP6_9GAMM|nr:FTR1 family protein [Marinomonas spartinae]SBS37361.1 Ferrous iron permease EfeU [Marinomonas spartinae]SBS39068.1 Ferrous iron permease EfeU [Marinomonas spartinae]
MIAVLLIVFREVLEAGLIISIVSAACKGLAIRAQVISGIVIGLIGAIMLAKFTSLVESSLSGYGQEIFTAVILLTATLMLAWQTIWMSVKGREMAEKNRQHVKSLLLDGKGGFAITIVIAIAVLREGSEVVLFLYSLFLSSSLTENSMLIGGLSGVLLGILVTYTLYRGIVMIPLRHIFSSSNIILSVIAAGLSSQAVGILANIGFLPQWGSQIWNSSFLLSSNSWAGVLAHSVIGYTATPMGIQLVTWCAVLLVISFTTYRLKHTYYANKEKQYASHE